MKPEGVSPRDLEQIVMGFDEAEALRLADFEGLYQEAAARSMGVSRQTFGRIIEAARHKVANALLNGKALRIEGGEFTIRDEGDSVMKIAVPVKDGMVDEHFGRAREFLVFRVEGNDIVAEVPVTSTEGGCKSGIASELARLGVTHLVVGNMGLGAVGVLGSNGIAVIRGASGDALAAARAFARGEIADSGLPCAGHATTGPGCSGSGK